VTTSVVPVTIAAIIVENSVSIGSPDPIFSARDGENAAATVTNATKTTSVKTPATTSRFARNSSQSFTRLSPARTRIVSAVSPSSVSSPPSAFSPSFASSDAVPLVLSVITLR